MIRLGSKVKDVYTGFSGIAVARTEWLYGCARIGIESTELKDGKPVEIQWFDEQRVEIEVEEKPVVSANSQAKTGGPHHDDKGRVNPRR